MSEIKSALELALERTKDVKSDKESVRAYEMKQEGKRLVNKLMEDPSIDLKKTVKEYPGKDQKAVRDGFFEILSANLSLPSEKSDLQKLKPLQKGFEYATGDRKNVSYLFEQLEQLLNQYLDNKQQLIEHLRNQFSQRIRQKEEEASKQMGRQVRIDPSSDPEFARALNQNLGNLQNQYGGVIDQVKDQLRTLYEQRR
jgi:phosphoenolpyruvate-protein kinase (PTS system EI component)